jgi:hypothetical protein
MMTFMKFGTQDGTEFEAPCFAGLWQHLANRVKVGSVYLACFCRDVEKNPLGLKVGRSDRYRFSAQQAETAFMDIDSVTV